MSLKDAAKKIPSWVTPHMILGLGAFYESAVERQREIEEEQRVADAVGVTVEELRILNNPLFSPLDIKKFGIDVMKNDGAAGGG